MYDVLNIGKHIMGYIQGVRTSNLGTRRRVLDFQDIFFTKFEFSKNINFYM